VFHYCDPLRFVRLNRHYCPDSFDLFLCLFYLCLIEYVPSNCFITRFTAAVSVLVGPCCSAVLNCMDVDVHIVVLLGK